MDSETRNVCRSIGIDGALSIVGVILAVGLALWLPFPPREPAPIDRAIVVPETHPFGCDNGNRFPHDAGPACHVRPCGQVERTRPKDSQTGLDAGTRAR